MNHYNNKKIEVPVHTYQAEIKNAADNKWKRRMNNNVVGGEEINHKYHFLLISFTIYVRPYVAKKKLQISTYGSIWKVTDRLLILGCLVLIKERFTQFNPYESITSSILYFMHCYLKFCFHCKIFPPTIYLRILW
jgi:hypothetical protein